jgi:cytochrome c-type biogenesis protein CcmE
MSLDRELEREVAHSEAVVRELNLTPSHEPVARRPRGRWLLAVAALAPIGVLLHVVARRPPPMPWLALSELMRAPTAHVGEPVRVRGMLLRGSYATTDNPCHTRLTLVDGKATLPVSVPACIGLDADFLASPYEQELSAEGVLQPNGSFVATQLLYKSHKKYEMTSR